jgi:hypothetical protein
MNQGEAGHSVSVMSLTFSAFIWRVPELLMIILPVAWINLGI